MRKIPPELENPIDRLFIDMADRTSEFYKSLNFTPNMLTTLSLITGLIAFVFFIKGYNVIAVVFYLISYYYDCCDGFYARKYKMESKLGDIYDHVADLTKNLLLVYALYVRSSTKFWPAVTVLTVFILLSCVHLGCQERYYSTEIGQPIMENLKAFCPDPGYINITKYFGTGTFTLVFAIIMLIY